MLFIECTDVCCYTLCLGSSETESFFLPFLLREASTFLPFAVDILSRNPCLFFLFLLDGWNVLFISLVFQFAIECAKVIFFYDYKKFVVPLVAHF